MSKSPNILIPATGAAALVLGVAYGVATNNYASDKVDVMERQVEQAQAAATEAASAAEAELARVTALEADMQAKVAEIQNEARLALATASGGTIAEPAPVASTKYGLGREAYAEEIVAWDVDILPDGRGLPEGRGDVWTGDEIFTEQCAACHGVFAEGVDNWPSLAGGFDTLADEDPVKTVGSYWPYLSTVWDYVHRSMPFGAAQTLSDDEVYAIVAYILYSNDLVDEDFELSHENFAEVAMYNADGFIVDDRAETEYRLWQGEPCMENCKDSVEITMRASVLDVTPEEEDEAMAPSEPAATEVASTDASATVAAVEPALIEAGEKAFRQCSACHQVGEGAKNRVGPHLNGLIGRTKGGLDGFSYSNVFKAAAEDGRVWDDESLAAFLAAPRDYMQGTKMAFAGVRSQEDIAAIVAYIEATGQ
ncbi:MAG: c-type cytochrome [Pseudomonadota bacterium]